MAATEGHNRVSVVRFDGTLRKTTIDKVLSNVDDESQDISAGVLFEMFDVDSNGQISYAEYKKLHEGLTRLVRTEHAKEAQLAFDVESAQQSTEVALQKGKRANRRAKLFGCMSFVLIIFLLISTGLNIATQLYVGELQVRSYTAHHKRMPAQRITLPAHRIKLPAPVHALQ
jgi:outer membrane murein-binding lipoprotein Lpp